MTTLSEALQNVADVLTAAGVQAVVDATDLNLPGAWVTPGDIGYERLNGAVFTLDMNIYLIAPDIPPAAALDALGGLLVLAGTALGAAVSATPVSLTLANQASTPLAGLLITIATEVD